MTPEDQRLQQDREGKAAWKAWGPYLSERQWGTVREDYGPDGRAWDNFTFEQSHYRAYRWGEDGLAGQSDRRQLLCFGLALWNGVDPVLKERLFGLTNQEGNHGEDVKEYYFYLDNTPTHSYQKYLYKYPQGEFPYRELREGNRRRGYHDFEYELLDTGAFAENRYFDVFVEYAKAAPDDLLIQITVHNRGPEDAPLHVLPTLWFRNTWSWGHGSPKPVIDVSPAGGMQATHIHPDLGMMRLVCDHGAAMLFTENETRPDAVHGAYAKDAFQRYLVHDQAGAVNPDKTGTKAAYHLSVRLAAGESATFRLRLLKASAKKSTPFKDFSKILEARRSEADEFYRAHLAPGLSEDQRNVARQAMAGMLWSKQYYQYDVGAWVKEHKALHGRHWAARELRNREWVHMVNEGIISMPDKWEYPWYAAWDLAFHSVALAMVDSDLAKRQLRLVLGELYMHPNGQVPAYEWNFSDVNPPVHAWATMFIYFLEKNQTGKGDLQFLKPAFHKLMLNFTWWLNRKDRNGHNIFDGGFLGLDNIGVFDRSAPLPGGGHLEQADGTAWMCLFCQNMFEMGLELANHDPTYRELALKFGVHFLRIATAMTQVGENGDSMWDEEDGFFYDLLRLPDGNAMRLRVRSMVGLLPFCAASVAEAGSFAKEPELQQQIHQRLTNNPELMAGIHNPLQPGHKGRHLLAILGEERLRRVLQRMLDPDEFLSEHGIRSLSRCHADRPYVLHVGGQEYRVDYAPAESTNGMFGGNSNWRGPVWYPVNVLIIRALFAYYYYYGDDFKVECPTGSGYLMNLFEVAHELTNRLSRIFLRDHEGRRPVYGGTEVFQTDPHWRDLILFYEYFHGDNGAGLGASHQTGWTGLVASLMQIFAHSTAQDYLERGRAAATYSPPVSTG